MDGSVFGNDMVDSKRVPRAAKSDCEVSVQWSDATSTKSSST